MPDSIGRLGRIQSTGPVGTGLSAADEIRAQALEVAGGWTPPGAPQSWRLTAALFEAIAACDELLEHLAELPPDRLPALLASAAITFMVRRDRPVPLAGYIPEPDAPQPPFDEGFFPAFRAFCAAHLEEIVDVCRSHRYQMNEVARCAQIALGIAATSANLPIQSSWLTWAPGPDSGCSWTTIVTGSGVARTARQPPA